ncbi:MAG TPA: polyprenol monophosphomannose synthase [Acidimicrobiales bacterium]|nr:polyprenol monophosphomannose synthase [Acidimicrobiales bacterium]
MRTLVVMPTYEEATNVREVLHRIRAAAPEVDILVVDDSSPDGTAALAREVGEELGRIEVVVRPRKDGLGNAYRHGFGIGLERGYERLVQIDADLSHDPAVLPELLARLDLGADLAVGSRYVPGGAIPADWPWHRRALSRWGNAYACWVLALPIRDATGAFRAYEAHALKSIDVQSTRARGYGFQIETAYRIARITDAIQEIPITFTDRVRGHSKLSLLVAVEELALATGWGVRDVLLRRRRRRR